MEITEFFVYLVIMAGVTYAIRALPLVLCKKEITNRFVRSFLSYVPYAVLGAMTFPASTICRAYSDRVSLPFAALCCRVCIWAAVTRKRTVSECFAAAVLGGLPPLFFRFSAMCEPVLVQRMAARPTAAG